MGASATPPAVMGSGTDRLTAEEFFRRYENRPAELVRGRVRESSMPGARHGKACAMFARLLGNFVEEHDLGHVMSNDTFIKTSSDPDTVRGADVCFCRYERLPRGEVPEGILAVTPDLVVEVRSPSETWSDLFAKVSEYLGIGVGLVIVLDPKSASASVYRAEELQQIYHNGDELTLPELPGFAVTVGRLFG